MPELPEVETTRAGIAPYLLGETIEKVIIRNRKLRWPISRQLDRDLPGQQIRKVDRRGKYILIHTETGCLILHLGMSGSIRIHTKPLPANKHDHVDILLGDQTCLRFTDPRRFGSLHWTRISPLEHELLNHLGPEPLSDEFSGEYLYQRSRNKKQACKTFIMDSSIVVGVGNIYANEALFAAGVHPKRKAGKLSRSMCEALAIEIKQVLQRAINKGGTTLRDFVDGDGKPGYFKQELKVYQRAGEPCLICHKALTESRIGQRSSFYCTQCQR